VLDAAVSQRVKNVVLISTDKAVRPSCVMGRTKREAELLVKRYAKAHPKSRFSAVRFGNVLNSSGSAVPKFLKQIRSRQPITITHREMTRYFMSIPEAALLVMQSGLIGSGGEVVVLDMGEPVKVVDLAKDMIRLSGFQENDIAINFTGLRPGEKLYEELLADEEHSTPTSHIKVRAAKAKSFDSSLLADLLSWVESSKDSDENIIKKKLTQWVPEYTPDLSVAQDNSKIIL
jgi:FlaA1/EpsC-like NDP-sugar epimerase